MTRQDLIAHETFIAAAYRREAGRRERSNAAMAQILRSWARASDLRAVAMRAGPLFADLEEAHEPSQSPRTPLRLHAPTDTAHAGEADSASAEGLDGPDITDVPAFLTRLAGVG